MRLFILLVCMKIAFSALPAFSRSPDTLKAMSYDYTDPIHSMAAADVVFKGTIIQGKSTNFSRTFAVEKTYKGPVRHEWTLIGPLTQKGDHAPRWRFGAPSSGMSTPDRSVDEAGSLIVGARINTYLEPYFAKLYGSAYNPRVVAGYVLGGTAENPLLFEYSGRLNTQLDLAYLMTGGEVAAERDRLLRIYFDFRTHRRTLKESVSRAKSRYREYLDYGQDGLNAADAQKIVTAWAASVNLRTGKPPCKNLGLSPRMGDSNQVPYPSIHHQQLTNAPCRDLERLVILSDYDNDYAVSVEELELTVRRAFRFYDSNGNGVIDDFDE